jgi:hypothetical protein
MRNDDPAFGNPGGDIRQDGSNILIGKAVKSISPQVRVTNASWQWDEFRHRRMPRVKARIKAGDLRHIRQALEDGIYGGEVIWLVQRGERDKFVQIRKYRPRHHHRLSVSDAAVNNPMSNAQYPRALPL